MTGPGTWMALLGLLLMSAPDGLAQQVPGRTIDRVQVRPTTLALGIEELAGRPVRVSGARVVGLFGTRVVVIDAAMRISAAIGQRDRIVVLLETGELRVDPEVLVGSTVHIIGTARTVLGVQASGEVPWPAELDRNRIERLEIRAAVLASSIQTADGVELTTAGR